MNESLDNMLGIYVVAESVDGGGKSVIVDGLKKRDEQLGKRILDIRKLWRNQVPKEENILLKIYGENLIRTMDGETFVDIIPSYKELKAYHTKNNIPFIDSIIVCEPTFASIGLKIRKKIINEVEGKNWGVKDTAEAYSEDRYELLKKLIIPALEDNKNVYSERSYISSIVYQSIQDDSVFSIEKITGLTGNQFAIQHTPKLVIIASVKPETALERTQKRDKKDKCKFENLAFQKKLAKKYLSHELKERIESYGSRVVYINTDDPRIEEDTLYFANKIMDDFEKGRLSKKY